MKIETYEREGTTYAKFNPDFTRRNAEKYRKLLESVGSL